MRRSLPPWADATVVAQDPDNYRLYVSLDGLGGQVPFLSVDVATPGPRDAVRGHWPPLPVRGTRGRVSFSRNDDRSGRWEGCSTPSLVDSSTGFPGQGNIDYKSHYAGDWSWRGADGTLAEAFADGGTFLLGTAMPQPTRHVVSATGQRQRVAFTAAERNPNPPGPFPMAVDLGNGFKVAVTASGAATLTVPAGQAFTIEVAGGASLTLNADGSATLLTPGKTVAVSGGGVTQAVRLADGSNSVILRAQ